jgi:hypothetical protein
VRANALCERAAARHTSNTRLNREVTAAADDVLAETQATLEALRKRRGL